MNPQRNDKIARLPDRPGEDGRWRIEPPNRAISPSIVVNRAKSSQIAFGGRPSRPSTLRSAYGRAATLFCALSPRTRRLGNEPPPFSALPGNPAHSHQIVPNRGKWQKGVFPVCFAYLAWFAVEYPGPVLSNWQDPDPPHVFWRAGMIPDAIRDV